MKRPSFQFYPGDWLNDSALRMVSVGARGLWIDMLCHMHQGSPYGYLKVNGKVILPANLARMTGATLDEVEGYIDELESAGVFMRDDEGCIYSKRMIRDEEIRQSRAAGGSKGGNPALLAKKTGAQKDNLPPNLRPTPSSSSSSSSSSSVEDKSTARSSSASASRFDARKWLTDRGVEDQHVTDWFAARAKKNLANTLTAFERTVKEAQKAGVSLKEAVEYCAGRGFGGFNADMIQGKQGGQQSTFDLAAQVQRNAGPRNTGGYVSKQEQLERNNRAVVERFAARLQAEEAAKGNDHENEE